MTYTFKLARRLAVSRRLGMFPALILFAACSGGDATAPDSSPAHPLSSGSNDPRFRQTAPLTVSISPTNVTVETNQLIRFEASGVNISGDTVDAAVQWSANGGTILPDGRFSAAATGTFMVLAKSPDLQRERIDTAVVKVVRRQPLLASLSIDPDTTSLTPGLSQTFLATGYMADGRAVPVGVIWSATGGSIDAGGTYVAGDTAGTYRVIATNTRLTVSDTSVVTIGVPAPPPPPALPDTSAPPAPAPPPPPPPALELVTLMPASATLAPTTTRQFAAFGRLAGGDSVAVADVVFRATGGTITATGLYTAGSTAGTYRVVATSGTLADTSTITVTQPLGSGPAGSGIPFGPYNAWDGTTLKSNTGEFTAAIGAVTSSNILAQITEARSKHKRLVLAMTGGGHQNYMTDGVFDYSKWKARMDSFNTPEIRDAVAKAVADGTIVGNNVMDEPNVSGAGDGNTWGPVGTMTKARVDGLCQYVKTMFPTLVAGVAHNHDAFEPTKSYQVCDFLLSQYHTRKGDIKTWRDGGLAMAKRDGHAIAFSLNTLSGGFQAARDGNWYCSLETTGGRGTYDPNCRMTAQQIRDFAKVLAPYGCALFMWRYDSGMMADPAYQQAFKDVAALVASLPAKSCRRG
jgi:hypothetical protein